MVAKIPTADKPYHLNVWAPKSRLGSKTLEPCHVANAGEARTRAAGRLFCLARNARRARENNLPDGCSHLHPCPREGQRPLAPDKKGGIPPARRALGEGIYPRGGFPHGQRPCCGKAVTGEFQFGRDGGGFPVSAADFRSIPISDWHVTTGAIDGQ